jgi:hypothetical protein
MPATFLGKRVPAAFEARRIILAAGEERAYEEADWRDAIVAVQHGTVHLVTDRGASARFVQGDILCLSGLAVRVLHNRSAEPAVLLAVSRPCHARDEFSRAARSNGHDYDD